MNNVMSVITRSIYCFGKKQIFYFKKQFLSRSNHAAAQAKARYFSYFGEHWMVKEVNALLT